MGNEIHNKIQVKYDFVFKKIFGKEGNESILKDFLMAILDENIKEVKLQKDVHLEKSLENNKEGILDVQAVLDNKTIIDIEIQMKDEYNIHERTLFYWSGLYYNELKRGEDYKNQKRAVTINIVDFIIFNEGPYHEVGRLRRDYNGNIITDKIEIHYIQIPKCNKKEVKTKLDMWMQFIGDLSEEGVEKAVKYLLNT